MVQHILLYISSYKEVLSMVIRVYDVNNKEVAAVQQDSSNVSYVTNVNDEDLSISGHLFISNAEIDAKSYLKLLQSITNKTIAYFKLTDEMTSQSVYISGLFLKNIQISYSNGMLQFRSNIEINQESMNQYIEFLETHEEI